MLTRIGRSDKGIDVNFIWAPAEEVFFPYLFLFETDEGAVGPDVGDGDGQQRFHDQAAFGDGDPDERS